MDNLEKAKLEIKIAELEQRLSDLEFIVKRTAEYNDKDIERLEENDYKIVDLIDEFTTKN
tara:strand:- start:161 stop:340 length:180 start_codon:yes stop_codon:yes gene_type:complete